MKCDFCGNNVEEGMKFCPVCGTEIKAGADSEKEQNGYSYEDPNGSSGYSYGQFDNGQPSDGQQGYQYSQPGNSQPQFDQMNNGQPNYGQQNYGQPVKQINGTPYLIFSILTMICCCLPLGIVSIVYASKINSLQRVGDYQGAADAAKKAKTFMIIGAVVGLISQIGVAAMGAADIFEDFGSGSSYVLDDVDDDVDDDAEDEDDVDQDGAKVGTVEASENLGDSWKSFTVQINDTVLTFPCTVSDVEAAGLTLDTDNTPEDYVVNRDDYELVYFEDSNDNALMFMACNNTEEAKTVTECTINGIYVDDYDVEDGNLTVIFPGGIQIGDDIGKVIEKWGETDDVYEGDYSDSYTWSDSETYDYCNVSVDPETDKVTMIDLDGQSLK